MGMRVISLLASGTEIVCALGAGEWLVGRSHECDNPAWVQALPLCSRAAFDVSGSSGEIDREVRRRLHAGEPMYVLDYEVMNELRADLLIAQEHCEVCAVTPGDVTASGCAMPAAQVMALSAGHSKASSPGCSGLQTRLAWLNVGANWCARRRGGWKR